MTTAAIIGCGDVSVVHAEALEALEITRLIAVVDTDPQARRHAEQRWGVPGFATTAELLESCAPDVVHICTPHDQHVGPALEALAAGVHVLLEKPIAHTAAEARRLVEAAERSTARIGVCLQNRYNATAQAAHEILAAGELGEVLGASASVVWTRPAGYYRSKPWRGRWRHAGGGLLINQALHTIDLLHWLVGEVEDVSGHAATRVYGDLIEVEDTAEMTLSHTGGARSVFYGTTGHVANSPVCLDIVAEHGTLAIRGDLLLTRSDGTSRSVAERRADTAGRSYWGVSHQVLIEDFHSRLEDDEPFWISPTEAMHSLEILKRVYAQSGFDQPGAA